MYHAVRTGPGGVDDGYVSYRIKEQWLASTPMNEVLVIDLAAGNPDAYQALWRYIVGTDLCHTISYGRARVDEPLRWLLADSRRIAVNAVSDDLYLRLLDIPRALTARAYAAPGELVLEVSESFLAARTGRYLLTAGGSPDGADCRLTDRPPDISLDVATLGATYLGGVSFTNLAAAGRLDCTDPRTLTTADAMFSTDIAPFCSTQF
jgi:predicted acetyltransferase